MTTVPPDRGEGSGDAGIGTAWSRFAWNLATTSGVLLGSVLARFRAGPVPIGHLWRPLAVAAGLSLVLGVVALASRRHGVLIAGASAGVLAIRSPMLVAALILIVILVVVAARMGHVMPFQRSVAIGSIVFAVFGALLSVPLTDAVPEAAESLGDSPTFLILLDAHPRADVLEDIGIDIGPFIGALQDRGFDHYATAYSEHAWTNRTLTLILTGERTEDTQPTPAERRALRRRWKLPGGFVAIGPAVGHSTIPNVRDIGADGISDFEEALIRESGLALLPGSGEWVMAMWRQHLEGDLAALEATAHPQVFAHFMTPHVPLLYLEDGSPAPLPCWPCTIMTHVDSKNPGLSGTLRWLHGRLIDVVDSILQKWPDATIVLFSDHGHRFSDVDESHKVFLAARTPGRPNLFANDPRVGRVMEALR